jgi:hypothetical protein
MANDEKCDFLDAFARIDYTNEQLVRVTIDALPVVADGVEDAADCAVTINKLMKACGDDPDDLLFLLHVAARCCGQARDGILKDPIYGIVTESSEYDLAVKTAAARVLQR